MRALLLHAHPLADSLHGCLHRTVVSALEAAGHEVDDCDLYAEGFDPVLTAEARRRYFDPAQNRQGVEPYVERLLAAEALILSFPVWCFGPPAILKGFMERVMVPGVSFALDDQGRMHPKLRHIRRIIGIATYGRSRLVAWWFGDPPRKLVTRYLRWFAAPDARVSYLALYGLHADAMRPRTAFIERVAKTVGSI